MEDLRGNLDDVLKSYNRLVNMSADWLTQAQRPVMKAAQRARENVEEMGEGFTGMGIPWWIPVAVLGFVGAGVWIYNMITAGASEQGSAFNHFPAGSQPGMNP